MNITLTDIKNLKNSVVYNEKYFKTIRGISIDSRKVSKGELFFAIKGDNFDGHKFIKDVAKKGVTGIVISKKYLSKFKTLKTFIVTVDDTIESLGELANIYRRKFSLKVIAITGSNGKTTTKEMIAEVLSKKYNLLKTEGNLNNHIGVPLTLFRLNKRHEVAVIEMGMNHSGELTRLCEIAEPDFGCITNIGHAHIEFFEGIEGIAKAKGEVFDYLIRTKGFGVVNYDDRRVKLKSRKLLKKLSFGFRGKSDVKGKFIGLNSQGNPQVIFSYKNRSMNVDLKTVGKHSSYNALCSAAFGFRFGVPFGKIKAALESYSSFDKRMQVIKHDGLTILNDSYNANPTSMKAAFETLKLMNGFDMKIAAVGDMLELGKDSKHFHEELAKYASNAKVDYLFCFGDLTNYTARQAKKLGLKTFKFSSKKELIEKINSIITENSILLVKGSRKMKMEEIIEGIKV